MASSSIMITATDARQNPIRESVVHDEARAIESAILEAVKNGLFEATLTSGSPMTGNGAVTATVNSVDLNTNQMYVPAHSFKTGDIVTVSSNTTLPSPLNSTTFYSVIYIDADHIKLAGSYADAVNSIPMSIDFGVGVTNINVTNSGNGYVSTPSVTINSSPTGSTATAVANLMPWGDVDSISVLSYGSGYTRVPEVQPTSQGTGVTGHAITFIVINVSVSSGGTNYRLGDVLSVVGGTGTHTAATVTVSSVSAGGVVTGINLSNPGAYTTSLPTLSSVSTTVLPGGGTGCTLNLVMGIGSISVTSVGTVGYDAPPVVLISGGGAAVNATATAIVSGGAVIGFTVTSTGSGYTNINASIALWSGYGLSAKAVIQPTRIGNITVLSSTNTYTNPPNVTVEAAGSGATISAIYMSIVSAMLSSSGGGYSVGDVLLVAGGSGTSGASIQVTTVGNFGEISSYNLITSGLYDVLPILNNNSVLGGTGNSATFNLAIGLGQINISASGSNYTYPPTVIIAPSDNNGTGAVAKAVLDTATYSIVDHIKVFSAGSGYTAVPNVSITSGSGATANATISNGYVTSITVTNAGENYTSPPNIIVDSGSVSTIVYFKPTGIDRIDVVEPGTYYTSIPEIQIIPNPQELNPASIIQPATATTLGYGVNNIVVTDAGSGYVNIPNVTVATPTGNFGNVATATATIGASTGTTVLTLYDNSRDYYKVWKNQTPSNTLYTRPYQERMDTVIAYFTNLGYTINRQTNPATGNTIQWSVMW